MTQKETARLETSGGVDQKNTVPAFYSPASFNAMAFAAALVADRFHVPLSTARLVCELANIGGRLA